MGVSVHRCERLRRLGDGVLLVGFFLIAWQGLYAAVGDVALTPPLATLRNAAALLASPLFWRHAGATIDAFAISLIIAATRVKASSRFSTSYLAS